MTSEDIYEEYSNYYTNLGKKLFDETVEWDEKEREYYLKAYWDWCSLIETAELRGRERGFKEGYAKSFQKAYAESWKEGYAEGLKEIMTPMVQKLKQMGMSIADIAKATEFSEEEIQQFLSLEE